MGRDKGVEKNRRVTESDIGGGGEMSRGVKQRKKEE